MLCCNTSPRTRLLCLRSVLVALAILSTALQRSGAESPLQCDSVSFAPASRFAAGNGPRSVALGDFNGDGKSDLAVANLFGSDISILLGTGTGSFGGPTNFVVSANPRFVAVGDFN